MAYIKTLKNNELIGGKDNTDVYPVSTTQAIFSQKPDGTIPEGIKHQRLEDRLQDIEEDTRGLYKESEKLVPYIINNKENQTIEIIDTDISMSLECYAQLESFGDKPATVINPSDLEYKKLTILFGSVIAQETTNMILTYDFPKGINWVGTYTVQFECQYDGTRKTVQSTTNINLRKYFGFSDEIPLDISEFDTSDFSNSVECTVTIPSHGTGFKKIYFAVPENMTISSITQPDAFNAPLDFIYLRYIARSVNGKLYRYKLYQSIDNIDSSVSKRLTIS